MLFLRHTPGESIKRIGKISRRPSSMSIDITNFEKGVKELCDDLEAVTNGHIESNTAESERIVAEAIKILRDSEKEKILNIVSGIKEMFLYTIAKLTDKNIPYSDMTTTQKQEEDNRRNLVRTIETYLSDSYNDIEQRVMKL